MHISCKNGHIVWCEIISLWWQQLHHRSGDPGQGNKWKQRDSTFGLASQIRVANPCKLEGEVAAIAPGTGTGKVKQPLSVQGIHQYGRSSHHSSVIKYRFWCGYTLECTTVRFTLKVCKGIVMCHISAVLSSFVMKIGVYRESNTSSLNMQLSLLYSQTLLCMDNMYVNYSLSASYSDLLELSPLLRITLPVPA